ncbi:unnamed protein product [Trichogramma brassicae]|uniref:Reverse transcriptase domain-containing protein n=1 Tax=Trichogramma brassicae TaxID=86971 RepID=A0A6H5IFM2_9HYME|nr:unnamed protein product [Trichogramma brassicae]
MYIGAYDEDDVLDELMHRVQGESETISQYLTFVRMQLRQCDEPPAGKKLARIIWRNLRPSYRRAMLDTCPSSMKGIEQAGLRYERGRELDGEESVERKNVNDKSARIGAIISSESGKDKSVEEQSQLGETTLTEHHIDVQGAEPIKHRPRRMSPKTLEIAYKEIDKMLADGVIERSASAWSSAPVIVKKADGSDRFCIDYRDLNKVTKKDAYPVPNIDHILDKLRRARYITTIDLKSAYFQIRMEEASKKFTAFAVPGSGLYQFVRMPFGLCNAPATLQRLIDALFGPEFEPHVFGYLDDIIIVNESFDEHMKMARARIIEATRCGTYCK